MKCYVGEVSGEGVTTYVRTGWELSMEEGGGGRRRSALFDPRTSSQAEPREKEREEVLERAVFRAEGGKDRSRGKVAQLPSRSLRMAATFASRITFFSLLSFVWAFARAVL